MTGQGAQIAFGRDPFAVTEDFVRRDRRAREFRMRGQKRRDLFFAFFALQRADREDQQCRPARPSPRRFPEFHRPAAAATVTSAAPLIQGRSGWRRMVPVAVQGASISTSGAVPLKSRASLSISVGGQVRCAPDFRGCAPARAASISTAVTSAPRAASCMVLPPGAAQRSITRLPATSPSSSTGKVAAASCTHQSPSAKPGSSSTRPSADQPARQAEQRPCSRESATPSLFSAMSSGACLCMGAAIGARGVVAILRAPARPQPVGRVEARAVHAAAHALRLRARSGAARH